MSINLQQQKLFYPFRGLFRYSAQILAPASLPPLAIFGHYLRYEYISVLRLATWPTAVIYNSRNCFSSLECLPERRAPYLQQQKLFYSFRACGECQIIKIYNSRNCYVLLELRAAADLLADLQQQKLFYPFRSCSVILHKSLLFCGHFSLPFWALLPMRSPAFPSSQI